jgi:hypothetical protein
MTDCGDAEIGHSQSRLVGTSCGTLRRMSFSKSCSFKFVFSLRAVQNVFRGVTSHSDVYKDVHSCYRCLSPHKVKLR